MRPTQPRWCPPCRKKTKIFRLPQVDPSRRLGSFASCQRATTATSNPILGEINPPMESMPSLRKERSELEIPIRLDSRKAPPRPAACGDATSRGRRLQELAEVLPTSRHFGCIRPSE